MFCGLMQYTLAGWKNLAAGMCSGRVRPSDPVAAARVDRQVRLVGLVIGRRVLSGSLRRRHRASRSTRMRSPALQVGAARDHRRRSSPGCS